MDSNKCSLGTLKCSNVSGDFDGQAGVGLSIAMRMFATYMDSPHGGNVHHEVPLYRILRYSSHNNIIIPWCR